MNPNPHKPPRPLSRGEPLGISPFKDSASRSSPPPAIETASLFKSLNAVYISASSKRDYRVCEVKSDAKVSVALVKKLETSKSTEHNLED